MSLTRVVSERSRHLKGAFPLEDAVVHERASVERDPRLAFTTGSAAWSYAVSLAARWPPDAGWVENHDGLIRVRLDDILGVISLLALDAEGTVIDEIHVSGAGVPIEADLVSAPLGICHSIVLRNGPADGEGSHATIEWVDCVDVGASEDADRLAAPHGLVLHAVDDWPRYYGVAGGSIEDRVRSVRYARLDRVRPMPWLEQLQVHIYPNDDLSRALYISGLYEPLTMLVLQRLLRPGAHFIDVGANAGLYSMVASRWVGAQGHVYAFEPSEREHARLVDHVTLNDLQNVSARRQAIGNRDGAARLRVAPFPHAGHNTLGVEFAYPDVRTERFETVETITLDEFVRADQVPQVDAIKMDIEGSEHAALAGATDLLDRFRPALIVEVSRSALARCESMPEQVIDLLKARGYAVYRIDKTAQVVPIRPGDPPPDDNVVALPIDRPRVF